MQTKIRLARFGAKKRPFYRIVISNITSPRDGQFIEVVGHYDPSQGIKKATINKEKVTQWISRGARPTGVVKQILKNAQAPS